MERPCHRERVSFDLCNRCRHFLFQIVLPRVRQLVLLQHSRQLRFEKLETLSGSFHCVLLTRITRTHGISIRS